MKTTLSTFTLAVVALGGLAASAAIGADQDSIQGTWKIQSVSLEGKDIPAPLAIYVFSGATLTIRTEGRAEQKATFKLGTGSQPKVMVVLHGDSSSAIKPDRTPYELDFASHGLERLSRLERHRSFPLRLEGMWLGQYADPSRLHRVVVQRDQDPDERQFDQTRRPDLPRGNALPLRKRRVG